MSDNITLTPEKTTTQNSRSYCPHLGLNSDRTIMFVGPTAAHRCYAQASPLVPDGEQQYHFCLSASHTQCPLYATPPLAQMLYMVPVKKTHRQEPLALPVLLPSRAKLIRVKGELAQLPTQVPAAELAVSKWSFRLTKLTIFLTLALLFATIITKLLEVQPASALQVRVSEQPTLIVNTPAIEPALLITIANPPLKTILTAPIISPGIEALAVTMPIIPPDTSTETLAEVPTEVPTQSFSALMPTPTSAQEDSAELVVLPKPQLPDGQILTFSPKSGEAGWWKNNDATRNHLNDSYLYAGQYNGENYISAVRFDLSTLPRGAPILQGKVQLTGLRQDQFNPSVAGHWILQFVPESALKELFTADFLTLLGALTALPELPALSQDDLAVEQVNQWELDANTLAWLEKQRLDGVTTITLRIQAVTNNQDSLFGWDSGLGSQTTGNPPRLLLGIGAEPTATPPLPTRPVLVATLTPTPENILTVVAANETSTAIATSIGTYTPVPYIDVQTPTPIPTSLAVVQTRAAALGLPPVLVETPTPPNAAIATENALYATAVAKSTGTFTPVPTDYITPMVVLPSPPAENEGTEVARIIEATARAQQVEATPTPLPYNAVIAQYIIATSTPGNAATEAARNLIARVLDTPTPLPFGIVVYTLVPTPVIVPPTVTPIPPIQAVAEIPITPTPTLFVVPDKLPAYVSNKILFKSNRLGATETFALDPITEELFRINEGWVFDLAQSKLGSSPDGQSEAIVHADNNGRLQIQIHSFQYGTIRQVTSFASTEKTVSYDPTWSPLGDVITFVTNDDGDDEIFTVNLDGSIHTQLTYNGPDWDKHPTWSPDGSKIVFYSNRDTGRRQLWIMNTNGSGQQNLSNSTADDWDPIWINPAWVQ